MGNTKGSANYLDLQSIFCEILIEKFKLKFWLKIVWSITYHLSKNMIVLFLFQLINYYFVIVY